VWLTHSKICHHMLALLCCCQQIPCLDHGLACWNRAAICLCGTRNCRGSFLYFAGNKAFMQVLNMRHTVLHRQAILLRASTEKNTQQDSELLEVGRRSGFEIGACRYSVMDC